MFLKTAVITVEFFVNTLCIYVTVLSLRAYLPVFRHVGKTLQQATISFVMYIYLSAHVEQFSPIQQNFVN